MLRFYLVSLLIKHQTFQAATGGDGKANWDEIIDTNLIGESNPDEVGHLANIAHRCLHKIPKRRPSISDVTQAISRIRQRRLMKEDTLPSSRIETSGVLRRIELQQLELNNITSMRGYASQKVWPRYPDSLLSGYGSLIAQNDSSTRFDALVSWSSIFWSSLSLFWYLSSNA